MADMLAHNAFLWNTWLESGSCCICSVSRPGWHHQLYVIHFLLQEHTEGDVFGMREQRFLHFASVLYNGEVYMTPQDFLHSVTQEGARGLLFVKSRVFFSNFCVSHWEIVLRLLYYSARKNDHNVKNLNNYWKFIAGKRRKIVLATGTFPWDRSGHARKVINKNSVTKILWSGKEKNKW